MNPALLAIILIPVLEIYLFIKIGSQIGAFNTILLIFLTAIIGVYYAKYEGLNTIRSGFLQMLKNEVPAYEIRANKQRGLFRQLYQFFLCAPILP